MFPLADQSSDGKRQTLCRQALLWLPCDIRCSRLPTLRLRTAIGFRNTDGHSESSIDWPIVRAIATHHLAEHAAFARGVDQRPA